MAKIEFSDHELEILKKVAQEYHDNGAGKAKQMLAESGITFEITDNVKGDCAVPGVVGEDACYACIACLFTTMVAFVGFAS
ncbi:hypothetical protein NXH76_23165 [Blautia schinkii]|nr:hypothetical protein [Blautia schinkii]